MAHVSYRLDSLRECIYCTWQMQAVTNRTQSRLKYYKFGNVTGRILLQ